MSDSAIVVSTVEMLLVTDNLRATVLATVLARLRFSPAAAAPGVDRGAMEGMLVMLILFLENMFRCLVVVVFYGIWHEICVKSDEIMSLLESPGISSEDIDESISWLLQDKQIIEIERDVFVIGG